MLLRGATLLRLPPLRLWVLLPALLTGCSDSSDAAPATPAPDASGDAALPALGRVSVDQLHSDLQQKNFLLLNVHVPREGQIPGTDAHVPYNDAAAISTAIGTDRGRSVVLYCKSNVMSTQAGHDLVAMGYTAVRYLDGGMIAWTAAGFPLEP